MIDIFLILRFRSPYTNHHCFPRIPNILYLFRLYSFPIGIFISGLQLRSFCGGCQLFSSFFSEFCLFDNEHLGHFFQCDCSIACLESRVWKTIDQIVAHLIHSRVPSKNTGIYRSFQHVARSVVSMPKAQKHSKLQCFGSCHAPKKQQKSTKECPKWTFQTLVSKPVSIRVTQPKNVKTLATKHCK